MSDENKNFFFDCCPEVIVMKMPNFCAYSMNHDDETSPAYIFVTIDECSICTKPEAAFQRKRFDWLETTERKGEIHCGER